MGVGDATPCSFSVVIPAYNEAKNIDRCLQSVFRNLSDWKDCDIVVVDNGSSDDTVARARAPSVPVIENTSGRRASISALRNTGALRTRGSVIAFLDGDMLVPGNWLTTARKHFFTGFVGALGFVDVAESSAGWVGRVWGNRLMQGLDRVRPVDYLPGRNLFVNRSVFNELNGFDEELITNEDKDFCHRVSRAGYQVLSLPDPTTEHLGYERGVREFVAKEFWRQGSTLAYARQRGLSPATLRNPALSGAHLALLLAVFVAALFLGARAAALGAVIWVLPALALTLGRIGIGRPPLFSFQFLLLTFLRWNVAGISLAWQVLHPPRRGEDR